MKKTNSTDPNQAVPASKQRLSIPEILLVIVYFLAARLIPVSWLDSWIGAIAFAIARKLTPFLSEYSIAFAANPQYFIHCHVLAILMVSPALPYLIIKGNGGVNKYAANWFRHRNEKFGGWLIHLVIINIFFGFAYFGVALGNHNYPLSGASRAIWISFVAPSALMYASALAIWIMYTYMIIFSAIHKGDER